MMIYVWMLFSVFVLNFVGSVILYVDVTDVRCLVATYLSKPGLIAILSKEGYPGRDGRT